MFEHAGVNGELRDIEEMVRAAGDYLEVGDDLRPQTLEEARKENRETSTRFWISVVAVIVFLAMSVSLFRDRLSSTPTFMAADVHADSNQLYAAALPKAAQANVDPSWSLVDAFSELRQRQAGLIEDAF